MKLRDKIVLYVGTPLIFGISIFCGGKIAGHFKTFNPNYWKQGIVEGKENRLKVLNRISGLESDGVYSVDDLALLHDSILDSTRLFKYMYVDNKGDLHAYDDPILLGNMIVGDLNVKYRNRFNTRSIIADLKKAHDAGMPVELDKSDLDERVGKTIGEIRATLSDATLHQEDLRIVEYRTQQMKWIIGGLGGILFGVGGFFGLSFLYNRKKPYEAPKSIEFKI